MFLLSFISNLKAEPLKRRQVLKVGHFHNRVEGKVELKKTSTLDPPRFLCS